MGSLPSDVAVEIEALFEVRDWSPTALPAGNAANWYSGVKQHN
jgi:hypothetical protein